jgi:hypothetical protein
MKAPRQRKPLRLSPAEQKLIEQYRVMHPLSRKAVRGVCYQLWLKATGGAR